MGNEIWVYIEHDHKNLEKVSLELLGEAARLAEGTDANVAALLFGHSLDVVLQSLLEYGGMDTIYLVKEKRLDFFRSEVYTHVLTELMRQNQPQLVLLGATADGNDLGLRVAVRSGAGFLNNCHDLKLNESGELILTKTVLDGKQLSVAIISPLQIATVNPDVFGLEKLTGTSPTIKEIDMDMTNIKEKSDVVAFIKGDPSQMDISEADMIVSGGKGINSEEEWQLLEGLAARLGAAIAGSRMAKDMGYINQEKVVGQTGKSVTPRLYLAAGISGATQHLHGIKEAHKVISINKDHQAPIMKLSDLAVVADTAEILPLLVEKLKTKTDT